MASMVLFTGCLGGPSLFKQDGDPAIPSLTLSGAEDADGVLTGEFRSDLNVAQVLAASDSSDIAGSSVSFPPGSLAFSTSVSMQSGASMANTSNASSLGVNALTSASTSVVVSSSNAAETNNPFTVNLSLGGTALRFSLDDPYAKLVVMYKTTNGTDQKLALGIIPRGDLSVSGTKVSFQTKYFGQFQAVYTDQVVTEAKSVETTTPILTKAAEKKLEPIVWYDHVAAFNAARQWSARASVSGMSTLVQCFGIADRDKTAPWDRRDALTTLISHNFDAGADMVGDYYSSFECVDDIGRVSQSSWSDKVTIAQTGGSFAMIVGTPVNALTNVDTYTPIVLSFDQSVNTTTDVTGIEVYRFGTLHNLNGDIAKIWGAGQSIVSVMGANAMPWALNTMYTVRTNPSLLSTSAVALTNPMQWSFKTRDGQVAPGGLTTTDQLTSTTFTLNDHKIATSAVGAAIATWAQNNTVYAIYRPSIDASWEASVNPFGPGTVVANLDAVMMDNGRAVFAWRDNASLGTTHICVTDNATPRVYDCDQYDATQASQGPFIVKADHDRVMVYWVQYVSTIHYIRAVMIGKDATTAPLSTEVGTVHSTGSAITHLAGAVNDAGLATVMWQESSVYASINPNNNVSTGWTAGQSFGFGSASSLSVSIDNMGVAHYFATAADFLKYNKFDGSWAGSTPLYDDPGNYNADYVTSTTAKNGAVFVGWIQSTASMPNIKVYQRVPGGSFADDSSFTIGSGPSDLSLSVNAPGTVQVASWKEGSGTVAAAAYRAAPGSWQPSATAVTAPGQSGSKAVLDMEGNALFVSSPAGATKIQMQRYQFGAGSWSAAEDIYDNPPHVNVINPLSAVDVHGRVTSLWSDYDGTSNYFLHTKRFK